MTASYKSLNTPDSKETKDLQPKAKSNLHDNLYLNIFGFCTAKELEKILHVSKAWHENAATLFKRTEQQVFYMVGTAIPIAKVFIKTREFVITKTNFTDKIKKSFQRENSSVKKYFRLADNDIKLFYKEQDAIEYSRSLRTNVTDSTEYIYQPAIFKVQCPSMTEKPKLYRFITITDFFNRQIRQSEVSFFEMDIECVIPILGMLKINQPTWPTLLNPAENDGPMIEFETEYKKSELPKELLNINIGMSY